MFEIVLSNGKSFATNNAEQLFDWWVRNRVIKYIKRTKKQKKSKNETENQKEQG